MVTTYAKKGGVRRYKRSIASRTRSTRRITQLPGLIKGSYSLRLPTSSTKTPTTGTSTTTVSSSSPSVPNNAAASSSTRKTIRGSTSTTTTGNTITPSGSPSSVDEVNTLLLAEKPTRTSTRRGRPRSSNGKIYLKSGLWASTTPSSIQRTVRGVLHDEDEVGDQAVAAVVELGSGSGSGSGLSSRRSNQGKGKGKGREESTLTINPTTTTTTTLETGRPDSQPSTPGSSGSVKTASEHSPVSVSSREGLGDEDEDEDELGGDRDSDSGSDSDSNSEESDSNSEVSREAEEIPDSFPPLPMYWGRTLINSERDFVLPWDLVRDVEEGVLDGKRTPGRYKVIKHNIFVERKPYTEDAKVICNCAPNSGCKDGCLNRAMNYLCGKGCPAGPNCTNGSLFRRPQKETKVVFTGSRGFGLKIQESVDEGEFIMDYRGEIIALETYFNRIRTVYAGRKDFYALDYDMDEGQKGNDARFINHSCAPNIEVRKYQTAGAGLEEYEIGFWALRDIAPGEELCYNYNFDSFTTYKRLPEHPESLLSAVAAEGRQRCFCGASNCSGWLGKRSGSAGEASNQASGSRLPAAPIVPPAKKRGRPKGVPNKIKKLKVVKEDVPEVIEVIVPSRRGNVRSPTEPITPTTPASKRRKVDDPIIHSESAIKKLAKARNLALAAAKECGISLERSNGRRRSMAQLGDTARLARTICEELSSLQAAIANSAIVTGESSRRRVMPGPPPGISSGSDCDTDTQESSSDHINAREVAVKARKPFESRPRVSRSMDSSHRSDISHVSGLDRHARSTASSCDEPACRARKRLGPRSDSPVPIAPELLSQPGERVVSQSAEVATSTRDSVRSGKSRAIAVEAVEDQDSAEEQKEYGEQEMINEMDERDEGHGWTSAGESDDDMSAPVLVPLATIVNSEPKPPMMSGSFPMHTGTSEGAELFTIQTGPEASGLTSKAPISEQRLLKEPKRKKEKKVREKREKREKRERLQRPHAILTPDRMVKSRLALLNGEQLEAERRARRQGPDWVRAQVESLKIMHRAIALRAVTAPPGYMTPNVPFDEFYRCPSTINVMAPTDTTVFSLILDVPFAAHPVEMWKRSIPTFPSFEQDDDEKTLVDPSDYETYQKNIYDLFGYVKNLKVEVEDVVAPLQDSETPDGTNGSAEGESRQEQPEQGGNDGNEQGNAGGDDQVDPPADGEGAGNAGDDDGDDDKKGPPENQGEPEAEPEQAEEDEEAKKKREAEAAQLEQSLAPQDAIMETAPLPPTTDSVQAEHRPGNEQDQQWYEAMQGIVAMQRATVGQEGSVPAEIGPDDLAAAQLEIYAQEAVTSPRSSQGRDMMTPAYDHYENDNYGSPGSAYGPDDYDGHDDDSFQRYIITHGLTVDEIEWSSVSDMTDLEEMEMNEREIVSTAPDMDKYNRSRRSRKPRPPRRFKTIITRIRPKLEAAITDVTPAEEDAALERERRRRKKGQAWLNSMKALAQARREAKARQEAGLPPPEFTLPPTSLTPSGQKNRVKKESAKTEGDESADPGPSGSASVDYQAASQAKRKKSSSGKSRARRPSPPVAPLPAYDYHDGAENQQYLEALGQENYDALLVNQAGGSDAGVAALPDDPNVNQDYSALIQQANESAVVDEHGDHHHGVDAYYQQSYEDVDSNPVSTLVQAANMFSNGQADAYMQNANFDYSNLQHNPYTSINFAQYGHGEGSSSGGQLPPVPPIGRTLPGSTYSTPSPGRAVSLTTTRTGEKRRRGPPVKKIAGAMLMPLTDEQWEAERKKRKKGFGWVAETKAAAEAERLARAQRAAGLPVIAPPRKSRPSNSGANRIDQQDVFGHADDLYHTLEGHDHHETLADAHQQQQGLMHDGQDDIVPFPSTADDDFAMGTGLYETQEQDMSHYADHSQNGNHYGDVGMS